VTVSDDAVRMNVERDGGLEVLELNITLPEGAPR
jgi:septum formation topological specificity factor MinE